MTTQTLVLPKLRHKSCYMHEFNVNTSINQQIQNLLALKYCISQLTSVANGFKVTVFFFGKLQL